MVSTLSILGERSGNFRGDWRRGGAILFAHDYRAAVRVILAGMVTAAQIQGRPEMHDHQAEVRAVGPRTFLSMGIAQKAMEKDHERQTAEPARTLITRLSRPHDESWQPYWRPYPERRSSAAVKVCPLRYKFSGVRSPFAWRRRRYMLLLQLHGLGVGCVRTECQQLFRGNCCRVQVCRCVLLRRAWTAPCALSPLSQRRL